MKFSAQGTSAAHPSSSLMALDNDRLRRENELLMRKIRELEVTGGVKDEKMEQMGKTIDIMRAKIEKMNMLIEVKDQKIDNLKKALQEVEVEGGGTGGERAKIPIDVINADSMRKGRSASGTPAAAG